MGTFTLQANTGGVDPNLIRWLETAAQNSPYNVLVQSGMRPGDKRFHGQGKAIDVRLQDPATGKTIPNYQSPENFAAYQGFANLARAAQMQANPEMSNVFRWGGYFSGGKDKYGALDLMHFDVGGVPTAGGGWDTGLTPEQAAIWGLAPGGGYTGPGTVATAFQEPALTPPDESAWSKQLQEFGKTSAASGTKARQKPQELTQSPLTPAPAFDAAPAPSAPAPAPVAPEAAMTGLADLFKVGEIGSRIGQAARLPGARKF